MRDTSGYFKGERLTSLSENKLASQEWPKEMQSKDQYCSKIFGKRKKREREIDTEKERKELLEMSKNLLVSVH